MAVIQKYELYSDIKNRVNILIKIKILCKYFAPAKTGTSFLLNILQAFVANIDLCNRLLTRESSFGGA